MAAISPRALFFDVFGTCVDWRKTVTDALWSATKEALNSPTSSSIASRIRLQATDMTYEQWGELAQEWRNGYLKFTHQIANDSSLPYKTVDEHHLESLRSILTAHGLVVPPMDNTSNYLPHDGSLWTEQQIHALSLIWHRLEPWPDACRGLHELNKRFHTCTLSNGNVSLMQDLCAHGEMPFTHVYSAEMFRSYKPSPKVYLGAAEKMGLQPRECAMVAAHLGDLKAAKANGFSTVYVERAGEERDPELKGEGFVDVWVSLDERGFIAAAEKLGVEVSTMQ